METNITIALVCVAFQMEYYSRRWKLFAEKYRNVDVWLLTPKKHTWYKGKVYTFGKSFSMEAQNYDKDNYHMRAISMKEILKFGFYSSDFKPLLKEINPDFIYIIGGHNNIEIAQILHIRSKYLPKVKVAAFSMRGPAMNLKINHSKCGPVKWVVRRLFYCFRKKQLKYINNHIDAFMCHYPTAVECFKQEGYNGPIYMQTQVGVNAEWFYTDAQVRNDVRAKYGIKDSTYVFGSATRFTEDKGVDVILKALPADGDWAYLMMGSGLDSELQRLKSIIHERGIESKVIVTGFIDWYDMGKYWNAVDCAIHVPLTTSYWEETFSLAAIQPQLLKKPVIGDTSGSVPYQIGFEEMIVPEGNVDALSEKIKWVLSNKDMANEIGEKMYERTLNGFEVQHLNSMFYDIVTEDILVAKYDSNKFDMAKYTPKS